jgi:hypothetical protein
MPAATLTASTPTYNQEPRIRRKTKCRLRKHYRRCINRKAHLVLTGREFSFIFFTTRAAGADGVDDSGVLSPLAPLFNSTRLNQFYTVGAQCRGVVGTETPLGDFVTYRVGALCCTL